ncbi:MAG TPA: DUF4157 domain-containing protein, partial [Bacteroidia bacterium]|nr:DUF4157 domain-containing protein [Bacteroidia bacterium]
MKIRVDFCQNLSKQFVVELSIFIERKSSHKITLSMEYIDRRKQQIQRAVREERDQEHWNEVHNQLLAIQKKSIEVSNPNDADEKEADEVARKVMDGQSAEIHGTGGSINRSGEGIAEVTPEFQSKLENTSGSGQSLNDSTRSEMESKMGADFSSVKIHSGSEAHDMSESINAKAFTHGQDVYFNNSHSPENKELLAHELAHTVQQKGSVQRKIQRSMKLEFQTVNYIMTIPKTGTKKLGTLPRKFGVDSTNFGDQDESNGNIRKMYIATGKHGGKAHGEQSQFHKPDAPITMLPATNTDPLLKAQYEYTYLVTGTITTGQKPAADQLRLISEVNNALLPMSDGTYNKNTV